MSRHDPAGDPGWPSDPETLLQEYRELSRTLRQTRPEDVSRQLPGLVDTLTAESTEHPSTQRFRVGVSVSANHSLFDYFLERVRSPDAEGVPVETVKEPVSSDHHYLQFTYPPDPRFDDAALRGALLARLDGRIHELEVHTNGRPEDCLSDVWGLMGGDGVD